MPHTQSSVAVIPLVGTAFRRFPYREVPINKRAFQVSPQGAARLRVHSSCGGRIQRRRKGFEICTVNPSTFRGQCTVLIRPLDLPRGSRMTAVGSPMGSVRA